MRNFLRGVRNSWPYRFRLILSVVFAILAAAVWSLNFLAIHPALKILDGIESLPESVEIDIAQVKKSMADARYELERVKGKIEDNEKLPEGKLKEERRRDLDGQLAQNEFALNRHSLALYRLQMLKTFYLQCLPSNNFLALAWLLGAVLVLVAVKGVFEFAQESLVGSVANLTLYRLRNRFYRNMIRMDANHFGDSGTHELMARFTNDMEVLGAGLKVLYGKVIAEPMRALGCIILACFVSWQLTLCFIVLIPLFGYVVAKVGRSLKRASRRLLDRMSDIFKILQETFQGIRVVKAFTMEPYERRRFRTATREYYRKAMRVVNIDALAGPLIEVMGMCGVVLALLAGAYLVLGHRTDIFGIRMTSQPLDPPTLLMYYALLGAVADPIRKLSSVFTKIQAGAAAADRIFALIDRQPRVLRNNQSPRLALHEKSITFRNICFSYEAERPILTNVNLEFRFGETIALVGRNGCGKTTMLGLLPRFYDPDHGSILIDGADIRSVNLRSLRKQIAVVTQETVLFDDTIYNNIAYGNRRASREQVEEAAQKAYAHEIIEKLPLGYDSRIGEAGRTLSGGEKQRLALARAIVRDPRILILDEFTSQIDAESEAKIHLALREFMRGRTTFVITHRLNTLEIADRIVVLEDGRIEAVGTHSELLCSSPAYQRLREAHFQRRAA